MLEFDVSHYREVEALHDEIIERRNKNHEDSAQRHDCSALLWHEPAWVRRYNTLLYTAAHACDLLRGYSLYVNPDNFPGMVYDKDDFPEWADDVTTHPLQDFVTRGPSDAGTKVPMGDAALPPPKEQCPWRCTPRIIEDADGSPSLL